MIRSFVDMWKSLFSDCAKVALRYADAITWDPSAADHAMWAEFKRHFSEPELVGAGSPETMMVS